jgi:hypothetical protein
MADATNSGEKGHTVEKGKTIEKGRTIEKGKPAVGTSSREAGVIVRASVEAFGAVGDTELTVHVKWPAATLGTVETAPSNQAGGPAQPSQTATQLQGATAGTGGVGKNIDQPAGDEPPAEPIA